MASEPSSSEPHTHELSHDHEHPPTHDVDHPPEDAWKHTGVRVIPSDSLDSNTAQTPGIYLHILIYSSPLRLLLEE